MASLVRLTNRSGYDSADLRSFLETGFHAIGVKRPIRVEVVPAPQRSRGCALVGRIACRRDARGVPVCTTYGDRAITFAIAPPSYSPYEEFLRRLSRLVHHEVAHVFGYEHEDMGENLLYSLGPTPKWAQRWDVRNRIRYVGPPPERRRREI